MVKALANSGELVKKPMSKRRRKNIRNGIIAVVVVVVIVVGSILLSGGNSPALSASYQVQKLTKGDLSKKVTGTGALALSNSNTFTLPEGVKLKELLLKTGAKVSEGDAIATLDAASLNTKISQLQNEVDAGNKALSQYSSDTATSYISSNVAGRVKIIDVKKDDDIKSVMSEKNALMVISVDGKMRISLPVESTESLSVNQEVTVTLKSGTKKTGNISALGADGKSCTVLLDDKVPTPGEEASVATEDGKELGKGTLEINHPQYITGNVGTCKSIPVSLNQKVYKGTTLVRLKNLPISSEYESKLTEVEDLVEQLNQAIAYRAANSSITSPYDGILGEMELKNGDTIGENVSLSVSDTTSLTLDVAVDELDILNIKEGMTAKITVDALEEEIIEGEVTFISASGTTENSVTKYPVTLKVKADERLLPGMSASADIVIEEKKDVLLVPLNALITREGKTFVWLSNGKLPETEGELPGILTEIVTGLSNDSSAEVVSGLKETDEIVITRIESTTGNGMFGMMGGGMGRETVIVEGRTEGGGPAFERREGGNATPPQG